MLTNNFLADKFPIESEVRAEAQEPAYEVVYFKRSGSLVEDSIVVPFGAANQHVASKLITKIDLLYTAPQPPAPCPASAESVAVVERYVAHGANCCAINRTPSHRMIPHGTRLFTEEQLIQSVESFKAELREKGTIVEADLQAKVAELEALRAQDAKAYERLDELRNRDADKIADQAALIDKCEKALIEARDDVYSELIRAKQSAGYKRYDDEIKRQMAQLVRHDEALAAIAAQKGGAA